jgi:hypothetical protein
MVMPNPLNLQTQEVVITQAVVQMTGTVRIRCPKSVTVKLESVGLSHTLKVKVKNVIESKKFVPRFGVKL